MTNNNKKNRKKKSKKEASISPLSSLPSNDDLIDTSFFFQNLSLLFGTYIKDIIYGGLDGVITTFAIVSGVQGASLSSSIILTLGIANILADGFSMAVSNYLGTKSEIEFEESQQRKSLPYYYKILNSEKLESDFRKWGGKEGFSSTQINQILKYFQTKSNGEIAGLNDCSNELNNELISKSPIIAALVTFLSFVLVGAAPLLIYLLALIYPSVLHDAFILTSLITAFTLFSMGAIKSFVTQVHWLSSGMEMLLVGGFASGVAYFVGYLFKGFQY